MGEGLTVPGRALGVATVSSAPLSTTARTTLPEGLVGRVTGARHGPPRASRPTEQQRALQLGASGASNVATLPVRRGRGFTAGLRGASASLM